MGKNEISQHIDLRGVSCPLNYVKTKLGLDQLKSGEVLEIFLNSGEAIVDVPRSVKDDGNKILKVEKIEGYYKVLVKKG